MRWLGSRFTAAHGASGESTAESTGESTLAPVTKLAPLRRFLATEAGGAAVLLGAAVAALAWANSPWAVTYEQVWQTPLAVTLGDVELRHELRRWINDGLMTLFFLLIGLEVRREFDMGEFRERRRVAVPVIAACGGMLLPILIFLALNPGGEAARGWAMVMTTDTAFAIGVLAIAGRRCPLRLRSFLLTLVIVDDIAAVAVIAAIYSSNLDLAALAFAGGLLAVMALLRVVGVQRPGVFWLLLAAIWIATEASGVHPGVAGVAVGLLTSAYPPRRESLEAATGSTRAFRERPTANLARQAARRITMSLSPNDRLQHALHPWTSFVVVPLFALANGGVHLGGIAEALTTPLVIGIVGGLVVGKSLGITLGAWLATRGRLGGSPLSVAWPSLIATSAVGGIGFTMSLLIAELSYAGATLDQAKLGIFAASLVAAMLASGLFRLLAIIPNDWLRRSELAVTPPVADLTDPVDPARDHIRGPMEAPVTLVEYGDFECPWCRRAAPRIRRLLDESEGQIRFVFRHLPLTDVHPNAALAAMAAEAAGAQGAFWEMHDLLFDRQHALTHDDLIAYAQELGLDPPRFAADLRSDRLLARVTQDVNSAEESGVAGTPTYFIDEVRYRGRLEPDAIADQLRRTARSTGMVTSAEPEPGGTGAER